MKVMLVNGSPHKNGTTNAALGVVAEQLGKEGVESEIFWVGAKPISGCIGCMACAKLGRCVIEGDRVNELETASTNSSSSRKARTASYSARRRTTRRTRGI